MTENNLSSLARSKKLREILQRICTSEEITEDKLQVTKAIRDIFLNEGVIETKSDGRFKVNITEEQVKKAIEIVEDEKIKEEIERKKDELRKQKAEEIELPDDMFSIIEGYDDIKEIIKKSLTASSPVHILLVGRPGTAKTVFLMEIERLGGRFILGGTSSKVGIRDILLEEAPKLLIIDEINEINSGKELSALLTWMESQRVVVAKAGDYREKKGKGWVFGACNTTKNLPEAILSRFLVFHFTEYSEEDFIKVCIAVLKRQENTDEELAGYIAKKLALRGYRDVRDAIKVARLSSNREDVDKVIETVAKYNQSRLPRYRGGS